MFRKTTAAFSNPRVTLAKAARLYLNWQNGFSYDFHKNGEEQLIRQLAKLNVSTVFDVGANFGQWSQVARKHFPGARIHAFEMSESTFTSRGGLQSFAEDSAFVLNNFGLSERAGVFSWKDYGAGSGGNTTILRGSFHDSVSEFAVRNSEMVTGDHYCRYKNLDFVDLLKIDVEGAEHRVIAGFSDFLESGKVRIVQFEYGYHNGDDHFLMRDFYELFKNFGYVVGRVRKGPITFRPFEYADNDFNSGPNWVAVRSDDVELLELLTRQP